jgi:peptidoglycan/LPS O-acetylase OafA/YrhL
MHRSTSGFIDASRWMAACLVLMSHLRSLAFANYDSVALHTLPVAAMYFVCSLGHAAVIIFFVVSGYLVGGRTLLRARRATVSLVDFASHRMARIYVVLLPALLTGYCLDWIGLHLVDRTGLYTHQAPWHIWSLDYAVSDRLSLWSLAGNSLMLQTIAVPPLGSNGALWSLANEWWYYVAFAQCLILLRPRPLALRLGAAAILALLGLAMPAGLSLLFLVWCVGVGAAVLDERWQGVSPGIALLAFIAVVTCIRTRNEAGLSPIMTDLAIATAYSLALLSAKRLPQSWWHPVHRHLARFSYSIYLVHFPAMLLVLAATNRIFHRGIAEQPTWPAVAAAGGLVMALYAYSWGFSRLTEARTEICRLALLRWCGLSHRGRLQAETPGVSKGVLF